MFRRSLCLLSAATLSLGIASAQSLPASGESTDPQHSVWIDVDADGLLDLHILEASGARLLLNRGNGGFEDVTDRAGLAQLAPLASASWGDADEDGLPDLLAVTVNGKLMVMHSVAGPAFRDGTRADGFSLESPALSATWLDYDADGRLDVQVSAASSDRLFHNRDGCFDPVDLGVGSSGRTISLPPTLPTIPTVPASPAAGQSSTPSSPPRRAPAQTAILPMSAVTGSAGSPSTGAMPVANLPASLIGLLDALFVNDQTDEVDSLDIADGSLLGADVSTTSGDVSFLNGRLGIGTTAPQQMLHVVGVAPRLLLTDASAPQCSFELYGNSSATAYITRRAPGIATIDIDPVPGDGTSDADVRFFRSTDTTGPKTVKFLHGDDSTTTDAQVGVAGEPSFFRLGNVGIGTATPTAPLTIHATGDDKPLLELETERSWEIRQQGSGSSSALKFTSVGGGGNKNLLIETTGRVGIGTLAPKTTLDVNGTTTTKKLTISGGADWVEGFVSAVGPIDSGTVVAVCADGSGRVAPTSGAADAAIVGVVSGAGGVEPGLHLGQAGVLDGDVLVAMSGRIFVNCCDEAGAIQPGDLLVSSSRPGVAMRAADAPPRAGVVIGKALTGLPGGDGLVLVLVGR